MDLEVFGAAHRLRLGLAHRGAHTRTRRVGETGGRAANSALQSHHDFLLIHRRVNAIHVIENLSGLEAGIILLPGLKTGFAAKTKMLIEHDGAPEAHEETTQGRRQGASAAGCAGEAGGAVNATAGRLIVEGSEAQVDIDRSEEHTLNSSHLG